MEKGDVILKHFGKYQSFGLREVWLYDFLNNMDNWFENNNLGNKQVESMRAWLTDAGLINKKKKPTQFSNYLKSLYPNKINLIWELIWVNLYYSSNLCRFYIDNFSWGERISKSKIMKYALNTKNTLSEKTLNNGILSLLNTFETSPLGKDLKIGVIEKISNQRIVNKIGSNDIETEAISYSLYKFKEENGNNLKISDFYSENCKGGPYKLFGIREEALKEKLSKLKIEEKEIVVIDNKKYLIRFNPTNKTGKTSTFSIDNEEKDLKELIESQIRIETNREIELLILNFKIEEEFEEKIENSFEKDYTIHCILLLHEENTSLEKARKFLKNKSESHKDSVFLLPKKSVPNIKNSNNSYAKEIVNSIQQYPFIILIRGEEIEIEFSKIGKIFREKLSSEIFTFGMDNYELNNINIWKRELAIKSIEIFLYSENIIQIEKECNGVYSKLKNILKYKNQYIVNEDLTLKENIEAPLIKIREKIYIKMEKAVSTNNLFSFNLANTLQFLTKPPYGFYANKVHMAVMGLLMRKYVGKLKDKKYQILTKELMKEKIALMFQSWENNTLKTELNVMGINM